MRRKNDSRPAFNSRPFLIHASSGEFEYARSLIRELNLNYPEIPIVVTYFSPSYAKTISEVKGIAHHQPLPLDLPGPVRQFLKTLKPRALMIARTDLWPELLQQAQNEKIPTLLFSATCRPFTSWRGLFKTYHQFVYSLINQIFVVSESDLNSLKSIGVTHAVIKGDTRYDQVIYRLEHPKPIKPILKNNKPLIVVAGSTWPEDEAAFLEGALPLLKDNLISLILVPHEVSQTHVSALHDWFLKNEISSVLYSEMKDWQTSVLIVDQVGILAEIYAHGDAAFVGGSFRSKVHSVMEPLAAGLPTLVGPFHANNREAVEFQKSNLPALENSAVRCVRDREEVTAALRQLVESQVQLSAAHEQIRDLVLKKTKATSEVLRWCENLLIK